MYRTANVATSLVLAPEFSDSCGLVLHNPLEFRPERLIFREILVRVTADFVVPNGQIPEDRGINSSA